MEYIDCYSSNVIYICRCKFYYEQYVGETSLSLCLRANDHRFAVARKYIRFSLFTHLQVHAEDSYVPDICIFFFFDRLTYTHRNTYIYVRSFVRTHVRRHKQYIDTSRSILSYWLSELYDIDFPFIFSPHITPVNSSVLHPS